MQRFLGPVYRWRPSTTRRCRSSSLGTRARDRATPADVDHRRMEPERHPDTSARLHSRQKQEERRQNSDYSRQKKERRGCVLLKQAVLSLGQSPAWRGGQRIYSAHRPIRTSGWICRNCRDKLFCSTSDDLVPRRGTPSLSHSLLFIGWDGTVACAGWICRISLPTRTVVVKAHPSGALHRYSS